MDSQQAAASDLRRDVDRDVVHAWLGALASGACDESAFLGAVQKLTRRSTDAGWDTFSLLDQYYRLGKISTAVFSRLRSHLGNELVGTRMESDISVPLEPLARARQLQIPLTDASTPSAASAESAGAAASARAKSARKVAAAPPRVKAAVRPRQAPKREITVGDVLRARYVLKSVLGSGGTGTVFEATDLYRIDLPDAGQRVALKVLHTRVAGQSDRLNQLQTEFQLLQSLSHPNIVRAHDCDRDGGVAFFTMEYLRGLSLSGVLSARNQQLLGRTHALAIIRSVGAALAHAHSRGIVHGDLSPGNIFITNDGQVRVLDFGAARSSGTAASGAAAAASASEPERASIAAPRFASCQVLEGQPAEAGDDVYALACVAYLMLAGAHPFGEKTAAEANELRLKPRRPPGVSGGEWQALRSGLAFDRERRPADVARWLAAFDGREAPGRLPALLTLVRVSSPSRPRLKPLLAAAVVVLAGAGAWAVWSIDSVNRTASQLVKQWEGHGSNARFERPVAASTGTVIRSVGSVATGTQSTGGQPLPAAELPGMMPVAAATAPPAVVQPAIVAAAVPAATTATTASAPVVAPAPLATVSVPPPAAPRSLPTAADSNGAPSHSRIELAADTLDVPLTDPAARVVVRRKGGTRGSASFSWWTESGTAKPGRDFVAVAPHQDSIADGKDSLSLLVPVVGDSNRHEPKSFYVVIDNPGVGASLGPRTLTMVTIPPSD